MNVIAPVGRPLDGWMHRRSNPKASCIAVGTTIADRPRTEPYERLSRIRLPPWMSNEQRCYSYTAQYLDHSTSPRCVGRVVN